MGNNKLKKTLLAKGKIATNFVYQQKLVLLA
jgi:hypothetical protein